MQGSLHNVRLILTNLAVVEVFAAAEMQALSNNNCEPWALLASKWLVFEMLSTLSYTLSYEDRKGVLLATKDPSCLLPSITS